MHTHDYALIRRAYRRGKPITEICADFACTPNVIYRAVGKRRRRGQHAPGLLAKVHVLEGVIGAEAIARATGLPILVVRREMRSARTMKAKFAAHHPSRDELEKELEQLRAEVARLTAIVESVS